MDEHTPVLVEEALAALALRPGGFYVDATFGRGGHTARILEALGPDGEILAIDRDPAAIAAGRARFAHETRLHLVHGEFAELATLVHTQTARTHCDGALFDFGVASPQLDDAARGFSFGKDGPLDMRMDPTRGQPVSVWLAHAQLDEIRHVIATLGEERFAGRIAAERRVRSFGGQRDSTDDHKPQSMDGETLHHGFKFATHWLGESLSSTCDRKLIGAAKCGMIGSSHGSRRMPRISDPKRSQAG